jgi:hypothetical protein
LPWGLLVTIHIAAAVDSTHIGLVDCLPTPLAPAVLLGLTIEAAHTLFSGYALGFHGTPEAPLQPSGHHDYAALWRRLSWNLIGLRLLRRQRKAASFGHSLRRRRGLGLCRRGPGHPFNINHNELVGPPGECCLFSLHTSLPLSNSAFMTGQFFGAFAPMSDPSGCSIG